MLSAIVPPETLCGWIVDGRPDLRLVDVRWYLGQPRGAGGIAYEAGHIPGAIHLDMDTDLVATEGPGRHPLPDPAAFAATLARSGIGDGDLVVAYDDVGGWVAARLWWMLEDLGFGANGRGGAIVLDGGLQAWIEIGGEMTAETPPLPAAPRPLHLAAAWRRVVDRTGLKARLGEVVLLDARGGPRYRGETEPIDAVPGHIPTAVHAPTDGNLGSNGRFLDTTALRARFAAIRIVATDAGIARAADAGRAGGDAPVVTSCGSGVSACHNALAMRIAGLPDPLLYPGSYSDWTRAGEPVAVGPEPGAPEPGAPEPGAVPR
jgi:thiosulfate/3-mercaptopyruvate sulfurtransferase